MSYKLTLTKEDRKAIDWIGDRYSGAPALFRAWQRVETDENRAWNDDGDFNLVIPEHVAWDIRQAADEDAQGDYASLWPCFAPSLRDKLNAFLDSIV